MLTWTSSSQLAPVGGWIVQYNVDETYFQEWNCENTQFELISIIPGAPATVTVLAADGTPLFSNSLQIPETQVPDFEGFGVTNQSMQFMMCRTPSYSGWDHYDVPNSHYVTEYEIGESASYVIKMLSDYDGYAEDVINTTFIVSNNDGSIISVSTTTEVWSEMWNRKYCEIDIPDLPQTAGTYNITIYFNGAYAFENEFYIVNP